MKTRFLNHILPVLCAAALLTSCGLSNPAAPASPDLPAESQPEPAQPAAAATPTHGLVMPTATSDAVQPTEVPPSSSTIWVTNQLDQSIVIFNTNLKTPLNIILLDGAPGGIVQAGQFVWVIDTDHDAIEKFNSETQEKLAAIPINGFDLVSIAYGLDSLWVGAQEKEADTAGPLGGVIRIDPQTDEVIQYIATNGPAVSFAFQNNLAWVVAESPGFSTINQIDPATNTASAYGDYTIWYETTRIAANSAGLWIINNTSPDKLFQLDLNTWDLIGTASIGKVPGNPIDLAADETAVWILFDNGTVARFDPSYQDIFSIIPVAEYAQDLFENDLGLWAVSQSDAKVYRIDTAQNRVVASGTTGSAMPTPTPTPHPTKPAYEACESAYLSRLHVGDNAKVASYPPESNRVREQPNLTSETVGFIKPGEGMVILDGPTCNNNWVWWKVQSEKGLIGWTAEGDEDNYWLEPVR